MYKVFQFNNNPINTTLTADRASYTDAFKQSYSSLDSYMTLVKRCLLRCRVHYGIGANIHKEFNSIYRVANSWKKVSTAGYLQQYRAFIQDHPV